MDRIKAVGGHLPEPLTGVGVGKPAFTLFEVIELVKWMEGQRLGRLTETRVTKAGWFLLFSGMTGRESRRVRVAATFL